MVLGMTTRFTQSEALPSGLSELCAGNYGDKNHRNLLPFSSSGIKAWESSGRMRRQVPYLILDCISLELHPSHVSFFQGLSVAMLLAPVHTFLVGFVHTVSHREWEAAGQEIEGTREPGVEEGMILKVSNSAVAQGSMMEEVWNLAREKWRGFVRPAYDGQIIRME
jgi:hypothetical protein